MLTNSLANGGGEKIAADLANGLSDSGEDIIYFTLEKNKVYKLNDEIKLYQNENPLKLKCFSFLSDAIAAVRLIFLIRKENVNTVISHLFRSNYINVIVSIITGSSSIIVTHGSIKKYLDNSIKSKINIFLIKLLFKRANKKIFLTNRMKNDYINYVGSDNNFVIPNCYDLEQINLKSKEIVMDIPFGEKKYFIFVGRFHKVKRLDFLLECFSQLPYNLVLIGDGELYEEYKNKYQSNKIIFLGSKKNPYPYIKNAKATLLTSDSEGFPNVLIESLSLNTPIISSDCRTGPREILDIDEDIIIEDYLDVGYGSLFKINAYKAFNQLIDIYANKKNDLFCTHITEYDIKKIAKKYSELL